MAGATGRDPSIPGGVWVVMPAYNAALTVERTFADLPMDVVDHVLLVDDCSTDSTVEVAEQLGIEVIRHPRNRGYGGNQKTCYRAALDGGADVVVMVHPDYQYDSRMVRVMVEIVQLDICDVVLGNRVRTRRETLAGGMPKWKYFANRASTLSENLILGQNLGDMHSGFRAYSRHALETVPFERNSDDFAFDQEFLIEASHLGLRLGDVPVPVRYFDEASSINLKRSARYGLHTVATMLDLAMHKSRVRRDTRFVPVPRSRTTDRAGSDPASQG